MLGVGSRVLGVLGCHPEYVEGFEIREVFGVDKKKGNRKNLTYHKSNAPKFYC